MRPSDYKNTKRITILYLCLFIVATSAFSVVAALTSYKLSQFYFSEATAPESASDTYSMKIRELESNIREVERDNATLREEINSLRDIFSEGFKGELEGE